MAGLDDDTLIQLLQMTAESMEVDPRDVEITNELEDEVEAYESALRDALEEVAMGFPPDRKVTAEDLWDAEASFLVLMTLGGHGVGIWDGSWDDFFDEREIEEVTKLLKRRLGRFADESGGGSLNEALMNAVDDSAGEEEEDEEPEDEDEDDEEIEEEEYESNKSEADEATEFQRRRNLPWATVRYLPGPRSSTTVVEAQGIELASKTDSLKRGRVVSTMYYLPSLDRYEAIKKLPPLRRNEPTELATNARRAKYIYRVRGTAGAYADRDRDFRYGSHTIYKDVTTEAEARQLAEGFMDSERAQGRDARLWIEETTPRTGDFSQVAKWIDGGRGEWKLDYDRKP